jgi:chemotaxis protein CheY-P-specific phosphatase CheC
LNPNPPLTEHQLDSLREVASIGAGRVAACLSNLISQPCRIEPPQVAYLDFEGIKKVFDVADSFALALHIRIMGDVPAVMFIVTQRVHAQRMVQLMTKSPAVREETDLSSPTAQFALRQMGDLLTRAFSDAMTRLLKTKAALTVPEIIIDTWSKALDSLLKRIAPQDNIQLVVHSVFFDSSKTFSGKFVYILGPSVQGAILKRIGRLLEGLEEENPGP